ncbi:MAG: GNAT family acetyltransferase [Candidatus Eisenbacteria bacterium]
MLPHEADPSLFCEVLLRLPSHAALLAYRRDPRIAEAMLLRDRSVVHTEIVTGVDGPAYHEGVMPEEPIPAAADPEPAARPTGTGATPSDAGTRRVDAGRVIPTELVIRPFRIADEAEVIDLWLRCELVRPWNDPHKDIQRKLRVQPELFLVARDQGRLVGTVMGGYEGHRGWVNYLAVDPDVRRSGIGHRLMDEIEAALLARGCPKLNLQMRTENRLAGRFYERIGYTEDQTRSFGKRLIPDDPAAATANVGVTATAAAAAGVGTRATATAAADADPTDAASAAGGDRADAAAKHESTMPSRASQIHLKEIDETNVRAVTALAVAPDQRFFVADNAISLSEALFSRNAWYRAVYADETPVGFCMIYEDLEKPVYYLWRFMIDARYQRLGFGRAALEQLIERGRSLRGVTAMLLSVVEGDGSPRPFYESLGFLSTDTYEDGELVMKLTF